MTAMGSAGKQYSERSPSASPRISPPRTEVSPLDPLLGLQQTIGNQAVLRLLQGGYAQPKLRSSSPRNGSGFRVQKKCAACSVGAPCNECGEEKEADEFSTAALTIARAGLQFQKTGGEQDPVTVENIPATPDPKKKAPDKLPPKKPDTPPKKPDTPSDKSAQPPPDVPVLTEVLGRAWCDPDQGKMVTQLVTEKIPACMLECAQTHEDAHVKFGQAECKKISDPYKATQDALSESDKVRAELRKNPNDANARKAQAVTDKLNEAKKKLRAALDAYKKWHEQTCVKNESQAYQAGIDACKGEETKKRCADSKQTERYKKMMKDWEEFQKKPPNC